MAGILRTVRKAPQAVVLVCLGLTTALRHYTLRHISIDTDTTNMLSPDIAYRRDFAAYQPAIKIFADNMVIAIDPKDHDRAEDGAAALYPRLRKDHSRFRNLFCPEGEPFFCQSGFLYLGVEELEALAARFSEAQPLLSTLSRDPGIRGLFEILAAALDVPGTAKGQTAEPAYSTGSAVSSRGEAPASPLARLAGADGRQSAGGRPLPCHRHTAQAQL